MLTPYDFAGDCAAMFAAAAGHHAHIHFPAGRFEINGPLAVATSKPLRITGTGATELVFNDCDGFIIDQSGAVDKVACVIEGIEFRTTTNGTRTAITYTGGGTSAIGQQLRVTGCAFKGDTNALSWEYGLEADDASYSSVTETMFRGNTSDRTKMKAAVRTVNTTDFHFARCSVYWADMGMDIGGFSEGITVAMNHMVPVSTGVRMTGLGNLLWATGNHISAYSRGVVIGAPMVNGVNHSHITGNLIFKNALSDSDFIGIECFGSRPEISGNEIMVPSGPAGGMQKGIYLDGMASYASVSGNMISDMDNGIELDAGCPYPNLVGNRFLNTAVYVNDMGSAGKHVADAQHGFVATGYSAAALGNASSGVNSTGKMTGKVVRNVNDDKLYSADGPLPGSPWRSADAATTITPS